MELQQQQQHHKTAAAAAAAAAATTTAPPSTTSTSAISVVRVALPDRDVTAETIEDAYVNFILHCNPAVPPGTDATALREAFRLPPKSGGKSFSTITLYQLIRQLETKELKTWAELALKLGVEPPDQDKGQSSQKIQQYAVRLKRWMHSMHLDAFFEYLMDHPHPYWTEIPNDPNPVCEAGRDGVSAEDDMALRALLPQIRPRRGRKRPDEDESSGSPSQRARLDSPPAKSGHAPGRAETSGPWSAHPDSFRSSANSALASAWPPVHDAVQTPLTAFPQGPMSALTPSTRTGGFWGDAEPGSAITPSRSKGSYRRHGAKAVSSAWRGGGPGGSGKTRGRPPINKTNVDGLFVAFSSENQSRKATSPGAKSSPGQISFSVSIPNNVPPTMPPDNVRAPPGARPARPSISLQVPERSAGTVRLATPPPPVVVINADPALPNSMDPVTGAPPAKSRTDNGTVPPGTTPCMNLHDRPALGMPLIGQGSGDPNPAEDAAVAGMFENMEDRTNIDAVLGYFAHETANGDWFDAQDNPIDKCSIAEAYALVYTTVERMWQTAPNQDAFLLNLAALAGGRALMATSKLRCKREEEFEDRATYSCTWQYRLGSIRGKYNMWQTVKYDRWRRPEAEKPNMKGTAETESEWEKKYRDLLALSEKRDKEIQSLRAGITAHLNKTFDGAKDLGG
ncbi:ARS binding protein 2 [Colletotrichum falcatum]|nr:ARS binding protein 2 [Colletotrichum falcatum]